MELFTPTGQIKKTLPKDEKLQACLLQFAEVHGTKYDYTKVVYTYATSKVIIICKEHGEFTQTPSMHRTGRGCPTCNGGYTPKPTTLTQEQALGRFVQVHGDTYKYTKTLYVKYSEKVIITCQEHGDFHQTPNMHIRGYGCPSCARNTKSNLLYLLKLGSGTYKVGITSESQLPIRLYRLRKAHGVDIEVIATSIITKAASIESIIKRTHTEYRSKVITSGDGYTEIFDLTDTQLQNLITCFYS